VTASAHCLQCGQPICRECVSAFGYFCGEACRAKSKSSVNVAERQAFEAEEALYAATARKARTIALAAAALVAVLIVLAILKWRYLAPGRVAWTWRWPPGAASVQIVGSTEDTVSVLAGDTLYVLDAAGGRERRRTKLAAHPEGDLELHATADGFVGTDGRTFLRQDAGGRLLYTLDLGAACDTVVYAPGFPAAWCLYEPDYDFRTGAVTPGRLLGVDLVAGREMWHAEAAPGMFPSRIVAAGTILYLVENTAYDAAAGQQPAGGNLVAIEARTGRRLWVSRLSEDLAWGPETAGGLLLMEYKGKFRAVAADGTEAWSVVVPAGDRSRHVVGEGLVFIEGESGTHVYELASGRRLWSVSVQPDGDLLAADGTRLLLTGAAALAGGGGLPPGLNQAQDTLKDMGGGTGGLLKQFMRQRVLMALDRTTGKELWRASNVVGDLFVGKSGVIEVNDTSRTSAIQMMTGGRGYAIVRQFAAADGRRLFRRPLDLDFEPYGLAGGRLVGVARTRGGTVGALAAAHGDRAGGTSRPVGVIGIRIRK